MSVSYVSFYSSFSVYVISGPLWFEFKGPRERDTSVCVTQITRGVTPYCFALLNRQSLGTISESRVPKLTSDQCILARRIVRGFKVRVLPSISRVWCNKAVCLNACYSVGIVKTVTILRKTEDSRVYGRFSARKFVVKHFYTSESRRNNYDKNV